MDLSVDKEERIRKKTFTLNQTPHLDGLILRVHHTDSSSQKLRFLFTSFNESGSLIASSDNSGNIFFINIESCKFWGLPTVKSCTFLKFSNYKTCEILVGLKSKEVIVVNFEIGVITGKLLGHESPPSSISFSTCTFCLTSSETEAIIWDLQDNSRLKILALEGDALLRSVAFIPSTSMILGCYNDNMINVWEFGAFRILRILPPDIWDKMEIKNISFSLDGSVMVISDSNPKLAIYSLKAWKLLKFVILPEYIKSIKLLKFISPNENSKSLLAILSGDGVISFYDILQDIVLSELKAPHEIVKFDYSDKTDFLSCVLCTGNIEIYNISMYIRKPEKVNALTEKRLKVKSQQKQTPKKLEELKDELDEVLSIDKLRRILRVYGEYPEAYRTMIWEQLLQLPNNKSVYEGIIRYQVHNAFPNLMKEYPVENRSLTSLKLLLDNLVTWCPFFAHVSYLPVFAYPFVKIFQNRPIVCFEAIATVILNWCQYWFEYFPLPPINVLAIIENMLSELDLQLLDHINEHGITSKQYAWPLLESVFSEVLTSNCWFVFWDHVLTNEPSFLLCAVVAYNIIQRNALLAIKDAKQFESFYHKQNPLHIKRLLKKTYWVMNESDVEIHPRKYLNMFAKIEKGAYPVFNAYPKVMIDSEAQKLESLKKDLQVIELEEAKMLLEKKREIDRILDSDLESIEKKRLFEMKKACNEKLQDQQIQARQHLQRLSKLRERFDEHQEKILKYSKSDQLRKRLVATDMLYSELETNETADEYMAEKAETLLLRHYSELVKHKMQIEALLQEESSPIDEPRLHQTIRREHRKIMKEINKISQSPDAEMRIRQYNIVSSLLAMDDLIKKVETALAKELSSEYLDLSKSESCLRNMQLQTETEELEAEVCNLLNAISKSKINESQSKLSTGTSRSIVKDSRHVYSTLSVNTDVQQHSSNIPNLADSPSSSNQSYPSSVKVSGDRKQGKKKVKRRKKRISNKSVRFACPRNKTK